VDPAGRKALVASVDVRNTGARAGDDVVQLYLRRTGTSIAQPVRELRGFRRVSLTPGEIQHLEFPIGFDDLAVMQVDGNAKMEPMHVEVYTGDSSRASEHADVEIIR
jgi:beta-glucosidase